MTGKQLGGVRVHAETSLLTRSPCALYYSSHTRRNKSCCHVTPASPAPYTVIVNRSRERKRQLSTSSQFHSLLAPYMVMVDRPLKERVSQSRSVYSLNQPGCRAKLVADTRRDGVRVQVITQRKHHRSSRPRGAGFSRRGCLNQAAPPLSLFSYV